MKCNYKRNKNISYHKKAFNIVDGQFKEFLLSENEYIKALFEQYDIEIVTPKNKLINALKRGDYVIGVDYEPFLFQNVFHYKNGILEFFKFENADENCLAPLRLEREQTILFGSKSPSIVKILADTMPHYDELMVCRKGNLLDIENI